VFSADRSTIPARACEDAVTVPRTASGGTCCAYLFAAHPPPPASVAYAACDSKRKTLNGLSPGCGRAAASQPPYASLVGGVCRLLASLLLSHRPSVFLTSWAQARGAFKSYFFQKRAGERV
jgi:hypothetical protein